ncbi:MAG: hypothetical protein ACE5RH_01240 [Nitrosarchaeum sp.]
MKSIILSIVLFFNLSVYSYATEMYQADEVTIEWDGTYDAARIWEKDIVSGVETMVKEIVGNEYTFTFTQDKSIYIGVQLVKYAIIPNIPDPVEITASISWSNDPSVCLDGNDFGIYYVFVRDAFGINKK